MNGVRFPRWEGRPMHIPVPGVGHHQDTGTVVNEINHSILQLKNVYIYISYLKGVFNLLLIGTWSGKRMIDYQDLSTLLVPIHVTSMPF
jgi:hypothetical protein